MSLEDLLLTVWLEKKGVLKHKKSFALYLSLSREPNKVKS